LTKIDKELIIWKNDNTFIVIIKREAYGIQVNFSDHTIIVNFLNGDQYTHHE
jgi:hypothetical protein